jgi:transaldolase
MNPIQTLHKLGQSIWLDYIERGMVQSGELKRMVDVGVRGVTSNPTIFQQAITKSDAYQADLQQLAKQGKSAKEIFESLAVADIQAAADVLRLAYDSSNGQDGFVSIEVTPDLAYDTEGTIAQARHLHQAVNRPNLMVKVPATLEGIPAIRQLTAEGVNVNITLIFSLEHYAMVMDAYLSGLEQRVAAGQPINRIASVASFFVSRVDTNVDERLSELAKSYPDQADGILALQGKIAVGNAKLAYRQFQQVFMGARWEPLSEAGAQLQRPLWASTSTKNPKYPDLLYVDNLIGPHTVNTMPPKTLEDFQDHGVPTLTVDRGLEEVEAQMLALHKYGISLTEVTDELEDEGVQKFTDSYNQLIDAIAKRRDELVAA